MVRKVQEDVFSSISWIVFILIPEDRFYSILIPPSEIATNGIIWFNKTDTEANRYKIFDESCNEFDGKIFTKFLVRKVEIARSFWRFDSYIHWTMT